MTTFLILSSFFQISTAVTLKIADDASIGQFCPGSTAEFECATTEGSLLWEIINTGANHIFDDPTQSSRMLGIFLLHLDGISLMSGVVLAVNSTAVVRNVQLLDNGTVLRCSENADLSMFRETVLKVSGPPPAPAVNPITVVEDGSINSTLLIRWSQSNCAVQYVVTIINSSDDRVYPNITTSNTNTAVTLSTGVEFCFILVAVDSISRRGPYSVPICYRKVSATSSSVNRLLTPSPIIMSSIDQIVTSSSTSTVSVTIAAVTPVEGGVNTAYTAVGVLVAIIVTVIPVLVLVIVGMAARMCHNLQQGYTVSEPRRSNPKKETTQHLEMKLKKLEANGKDVKSKYKGFLKHYYRDPLPHDDKQFVSNPNKCGYTELAIIEKDVKTSPAMENMNDSSPSSTKDKSQSIVALNDILKPYKKGKPVQPVLIEGTSGIGKTTLAWQLCHKWAKEELGSLKDYDLVILVRLRENGAQKATKLEHLLPYDDTTDLEGLIAAIGKGERVLIVCDGFDELPHHQQGSDFYVRLFSCELLPEATIIVTTRPSASASFKQNIHRKLEIAGFTENGIMEFAKSIFSTDVLVGFLQNNPSIYSMMYLPLSAVIVAQIYEENYKTDTPFPNTMSEFFDAFTCAVVQRHLDSTDQNIAMPSSLQDIKKLPLVASQLFKIVKIAYDGMCNNSYVFNELSEDFEHFGLMRKVTNEDFAHGRYVTFAFSDRTLQEYLAALHIANQLSSDLNYTLKLQLEKKSMIARFLAEICHNNCHDYCSNLHQWLVKFLRQICFDRSQALQLVHCAYECPSIMPILNVEYSEKNAFIVVEPEVGIDWYAMGYCISHFDVRWGLHATSLKKENIDLLKKGLSITSPLTITSPTSVSCGLKYLHISKSEVSVSSVITSLGKSCRLECLELLYVKIDEKDKEALRKLIEAKEICPESLTYRTDNEHTHTRSLIPMLLDDSSLKELVVRTGSEVNIDTELLPRKNTNLKKLTISCELVQPLAALLPNTSLTHLVVDSLVYDSDLPFLTSLVESNSTLQVLELGKIVDYASNPRPTYTLINSASRNLRKLVEVASTHGSSQKLKLHKENYKCLPEYHDNSTVCSH